MKTLFVTACLSVISVVSCTKQDIKTPIATRSESTALTTANDSIYVGAYYGGGIVFWLNNSGTHGLIAYTGDLVPTLSWSDTAAINPYRFTGATGAGLGSGKGNTRLIVDVYGVGVYAARTCSQLSFGEYNDWYLPSIDELEKMYDRKDIIGGFAPGGIYWSSTEYDASRAYTVRFGPKKVRALNLKDDMQHPVRPIRAF